MQKVRKSRPDLRCEPLEARDCPAIFVFGGVLTVIGTSGADTVELLDDGAGGVTATLNGATRTATNVRAVAVYTGAGGDTIEYTVGEPQTADLSVAVYAGGGSDTVTLDAGDVTGKFAFAVLGGGGNDTLAAAVGGVAGGGLAAVALDGGWGDDAIEATAAGEIDGDLAVSLNGNFGADTVTGEIDVAAGSTGRLAARAAGGFGDDDLTLNVTGAGLDELASLRAVMNGGPGTDAGVSTPNVTRISIEG